MERAKKRIAIIGGGLRGLTAAYIINQTIKEENLPFEFILLEERTHVGGMIKTIEVDGKAVDVGASSFDTRRKDVRPFLKEIGLADEIQYSQGESLSRFNGHRFVFLEKPTYHGIPIYLKDFLAEPDLSFTDKLAIIAKSLCNNKGQKKNKAADSTYQFLEKRFSQEVADMFAYPHYSENIYGSMELCPPAFFDPHLLTLYEETQVKRKLSHDQLEKLADGSGKEYSLKNGLGSLVKHLTSNMMDNIETGKQVTEIKKLSSDLLLLKVNEKEEIRVGSIISTIPLLETQRILDRNFENEERLPKGQLSGMGTVFFQYPKGAIRNYPPGFGFAIPKKSYFHITKTVILNQKWASLADASEDYLMVDFGRRQEEKLIELSDEAILTILERELREILDLSGTYRSAQVFRWQQAVPHFTPEEREIIQNMEARGKETLRQQGIFIGANGLHGYGLPQAILEGRELAGAAIRYMKNRHFAPLN